MVGQQSSYIVKEKFALIAKDLETKVGKETNTITPPKPKQSENLSVQVK